MQPALQQKYLELIPTLMTTLKLGNVNQVPKLQKIVVNCSVGSQQDRKVAVEDATNDLALITGQKPVVSLSKKAISNFKLRQGEPLGVKVTLRGKKMYDFMLRLLKTAVPRIRDFRGIPPKAFDGRGNYTLGITDQSIFPEIELDKVKRTLGFDITFVTTTESDDHARVMLKALGMPFRDRTPKNEADTTAGN